MHGALKLQERGSLANGEFFTSSAKLSVMRPTPQQAIPHPGTTHVMTLHHSQKNSSRARKLPTHHGVPMHVAFRAVRAFVRARGSRHMFFLAVVRGRDHFPLAVGTVSWTCPKCQGAAPWARNKDRLEDQKANRYLYPTLWSRTVRNQLGPNLHARRKERKMESASQCTAAP